MAELTTTDPSKARARRRPQRCARALCGRGARDHRDEHRERLGMLQPGGIDHRSRRRAGLRRGALRGPRHRGRARGRRCGLARVRCARPPSRNCARARRFSTSAPAPARTSSSPPRRVGPSGKAIGLDMTDEMLELARKNASEAGLENVEFHKGYIEEIPLADESVDVVISNCVLNLSGDKPRVIREAARVLRARRAVRDLRRDRRRGHGRGDTRGHEKVDRLHRRRSHPPRVREGARRCRPRRRRDPRDPPRPRARSLGHHPRAQAAVSRMATDTEIQLNDPQTLYKRWEDSQWSPFTINLAEDDPRLGRR